MNKVLLLITGGIILLNAGCFRSSNNENVKRTKKNTISLFQKEVFKLNAVEELYDFLTYNENNYPLVSIHRGGGIKNYPENALESFSYFASRMPAIIECDVRLSKDDIMVLMHDETLERTTNGHGKVKNHTLKELKELRLRDGDGNLTNYQIPTLEEALLWGKGKVVFTLDVKKEVSYQKLAALINKTNASAYSIIITYTVNQAVAMHRVDPGLMISSSIKSEADLRRLSEANIADNKLVAFVGTSQPDEKLVNLLHSHGIKIILGTLGNLDKQAASKGYQVYAEYVNNGADIISTDRPLEAQKALDYYIRKRGITSPYIN